MKSLLKVSTSERRVSMVTVIIGVLIALYSGLIIYRKIKDLKQGKYCGCGCNHCSLKCKENNFENKQENK